MCEIIILNEKNEQKYKIKNLSYADTYPQRLIGLMGKNKFNGLIFKQKHPDKINGSIHTSFMKTPIDILYINKEKKIQETITLTPWKLYIPKKGNIKYIIELPEKSILKYELQIGDKVVVNHERKKN